MAGNNNVQAPAAAGEHRSKSQPLSREAIFYMVLLAFQFGLQPVLTRRFTPPTVCRSTVIFVQECLKFVLALSMLQLSGGTKTALEGKISCRIPEVV